MSRRVVLVHGWASAWSGKYDIDRLAPFFEEAGYQVEHFDYGFHLLVSPWNDKWADRLWRIIKFGDVLVGHSNAAVLIHQVSIATGSPRCRAVLLNPVLDRKAVFGPALSKIDVFHTPSDIAVRIAGLLPWHPWGWAGVEGINTDDPRVTNHDMSRDYPVKVRSHLGIFREPALSFYGRLMAGLG